MRIKELSRIILHTQEKIISLNKTRFQEFLDNWSQEFSVTMRIISDFVTHIDVIASNAKAADVYKWCKPKIEELPTKASYITARGVRHPIVEKVGVEKYVVNDVLIGAHDPTGILLFGVNSSGKSVYLKSIGIAVILSQAGLYVPAKTFTYYPFHHIVTKISMNDNIYKHRSTFECEMLDLMRMLDKASPNIIILADELCSGTNTTDAISLVGSSVIDFSQKAANFVFTSHLHQLINIPEIVSLRSVSFKHISVDVDASGIHYSRTLKDGSGPSTYGIELASFMGVGSESFIKNAKAIRNTLDRNSQSKSLVSTKSSRYNTNLHLTACDVCGSTEKLETHHITPQVLADENGMLPDGRHKNHRSNLQVLCEGCHDKIPTQRKTTKMKNK